MTSPDINSGSSEWLPAALERSGLKLTSQRTALARLLFGGGKRHLAAKELYAEALAADVDVCLATVYNTLQQFSRHGLLREIALGNGITYFDTNITEHHHIFLEDSLLLIDSPSHDWCIGELPVPAGYQVVKVDLIMRLNRRRAA